MATIRRTQYDINGEVVYQALQEHCSHASAAGAFQVIKKGSLISKDIKPNSTTVISGTDKYVFENVEG